MSEQNASENDDNSGGSGKIEFTPEQHNEINRIVAARSAEAAEKAAKERQAEIDAYLAAEAEKAKLDEMAEVDRLRIEAEQAKAAAEEAAAQVAATEARANATTALYAAGVNPDVIGDALRLIDISSDDINGEVESLKARLPAIFNDDTPPPAPAGVRTTPRNDRVHPGGKSAVERARERAAARGII